MEKQLSAEKIHINNIRSLLWASRGNPGDAILHAIRDDHTTEYVVTYSKNRTSGYIFFLFEKEFTTISPWGSEFENLSGGSYDKKGRGRK